MLTHTEDHPVCVAVHEAIVRAENSALCAEGREFALDCIEDALAHSTAEMLEEARERLIEAAVKGLTARIVTQEESAWLTMLEQESQPKPPKQRSCQGCGWPIDSTVLQWYCRICDPNGKREEIRAEAELFEKHGI